MFNEKELIEKIENIKRKARRIVKNLLDAWRNFKDRLSAHLVILKTKMVTIVQALLLYFMNKDGKTMFELYNDGDLYLENRS